jgi:hypothetical protein
LLPIGWDTETTISELSKLTILNHFYVIPGAESLFITVVLGSSEFLPQPVFKNWRPAVLRIAPKEALLLQMLEVVKLQKRISKALPVDWLTFSWQTTPRRSVVNVACSDILKGQRTALDPSD